MVGGFGFYSIFTIVFGLENEIDYIGIVLPAVGNLLLNDSIAFNCNIVNKFSSVKRLLKLLVLPNRAA